MNFLLNKCKDDLEEKGFTHIPELPEHQFYALLIGFGAAPAELDKLVEEGNVHKHETKDREESISFRQILMQRSGIRKLNLPPFEYVESTVPDAIARLLDFLQSRAREPDDQNNDQLLIRMNKAVGDQKAEPTMPQDAAEFELLGRDKKKEETHWLTREALTPSETAELVRLSQSLGPDPSVQSRTKSICYVMLDKTGTFRKLSQNYFIQSKSYNGNPLQGGNRRYYNLLSDEVITSAPMVKLLEMHKRKFNHKHGTIMLIQIQTTREERKNGDVTEQGIHTDGADEAALVCLERKNVSGAWSELYEDIRGERPILQDKILQPGDALWFRDNQVYHNVTSISPKDPEQGPALRTMLLMHTDAAYLMDGLENKNNNLYVRPRLNKTRGIRRLQ